MISHVLCTVHDPSPFLRCEDILFLMRVMQILDAILVMIVLVPWPCHVLDIRPGERDNEFCFSTRRSLDM